MVEALWVLCIAGTDGAWGVKHMPARDLDRMRSILLKLEGNEFKEFGNGWVQTNGEDFFEKTDQYQIVLLNQAGFIEINEHRTIGSVVPDLLRVTFHGHDYIGAIKDEGIWESTKTAVAETGGSAGLEIVKALALGFVKQKLSKHTGIDL